ncbi:hypothetical protein PCYB_003960, partial [Plasmodium cynomolgi strain B]
IPFLEDIWEKYILDKYVNDGNEPKFFISCNSNISHSKRINVGEQMDICRTLLRSMKHLYSTYKSDNDLSKHCYNIYYWLYYEIKQHSISYDTIQSIFDSSNSLIEKKQKNVDCFDLKLYKIFDEAENLVMLHIFNNNINVIREILTQNDDSNICSCKEFIQQCIDSYRNMRLTHCPNVTFSTEKMHTCLPVNMFETNYKELHSSKLIDYELSELSSITSTNIIDDCQSEKIDADQASTVQNIQSDPSIIQRASHA